MKKLSDAEKNWEEKRAKIIGFGESSTRKSYYPELQKKINELERFRTLLDKTSDAIFIIELDSKNIFEINNSVITLIGYKENDILNKNFFKFIKKDDVAKIENYFESFSNKKISYTLAITTQIINSRGQEIPVEINFDASEFENQKFIIAVIRDISDRKKAEEELWRASEFRRAIIDNAGHCIISTNPTGIIQLFNKGAQTLLGYSSEELIGKKTPYTLHDPEEIKEKAIKYSQELNQKITESFDVFTIKTKLNLPNSDNWHYIAKDGSRIPVNLTITPIYDLDKNISGYIGTAYDISETKKSERELREIATNVSSNTGSEYFKNIINYLASTFAIDICFVAEVDRENSLGTTLAYFENQQLMKNFSYSILETPCIKVVNQKTAIRIDNLQKEYPKNKGLAKRNLNYYLGIPLETKNDNVIGVIVAICRSNFKDFERLKSIMILIAARASAEIQRMKSERELVFAKEGAEKADRLKSEFLAQMSHEIRTPVNSILSFSSLLKSELESILSDDLKSSFEIMANSGNRLIRTIDAILNMAQIQTGTHELHFEEFNVVTDLLNKIVNEYAFIAQQKKIKISLELKTAEPLLKADIYSVGQIFDNLINNAVKYTNEGSIDIIVSSNEKNQTVIEIKDTGVGISPKYLPKLFDPFSQEEQGYTRKFEGNGLGLALVKKYCDLNGAEISVESEKDKGSCFTVKFNNTD